MAESDARTCVNLYDVKNPHRLVEVCWYSDEMIRYDTL